MINLTQSIINTKNTIFMHRPCGYARTLSHTHAVHMLHTIQSIWLSFQIHLQREEVDSCLSTLRPFFGKLFGFIGYFDFNAWDFFVTV